MPVYVSLDYARRGNMLEDSSGLPIYDFWLNFDPSIICLDVDANLAWITCVGQFRTDTVGALTSSLAFAAHRCNDPLGDTWDFLRETISSTPSE